VSSSNITVIHFPCPGITVFSYIRSNTRTESEGEMFSCPAGVISFMSLIQKLLYWWYLLCNKDEKSESEQSGVMIWAKW